MDDPTKYAIEKLKIIKKLANHSETVQVCEVIIEWLKENREKGELGFTAGKEK